jgi:hypothetical protein
MLTVLIWNVQKFHEQVQSVSIQEWPIWVSANAMDD